MSKKTTTTTETPMKNKLVFTTGGKGGVGKTLTIVSLADALFFHGREELSIVDTDTENEKAGGLTHYLPASLSDLRDKERIDILLEDASQMPLTIVDMPANAAGDFITWFQDSTDPEVIEAMNLEIIALGVLNPDDSSWLSVLKWYAALGNNVKYAIVLNRFREDRVKKPLEALFPFYFESSKKAEISPIVEIEMPAIFEPTRKKWQEKGGSLKKIIEDADLSLIEKARLKKFSDAMRANWKPFIDLL